MRTLLGSLAAAELDLHGARADAAERRARDFLVTWSRREPGAVVRIVTGRGNRSPGPPVLRGRVADVIADSPDVVAEHVLEPSGGSFLVKVR